MRVFIVGSFVVACSVKVARLPRAGESLDAEAFVAEPGGKGFNLAVAASRLGAHVDGAFAIGDDAFASLAREAFARAGFPADMLVTRPGSTGAGIGFIDTAGENCLAVGLGANRSLRAEDVLRPGLDQADIVMATFESPDEAIAAAFARAQAAGIRTMLNPSPIRPIHPRILAATGILVVNEIEAVDLGLDVAHPATAEAFVHDGPGLLVITLGEAGAMAFPRHAPPIRQNAFRIEPIDTIGAGDAFSAALAISLIEGRPIAHALARAAACGAMTAARLGAFDAFPTAGELDRFLRL